MRARWIWTTVALMTRTNSDESPNRGRQASVGTEEGELQCILSCEQGRKSARMRITLLAAGFVVGSRGQSLKQIEQTTNTRIYSKVYRGGHVVSGGAAGGQRERPTRIFFISSAKHGDLVRACRLIEDAVQRYKTLLAGGNLDCDARVVPRMQPVDGVLFRYEPSSQDAAPGAAEGEGEEDGK